MEPDLTRPEFEGYKWKELLWAFMLLEPWKWFVQVFIVVGIAKFFLSWKSRWPPGPRVLPFIGCLLLLDPDRPSHQTFAKLAEKYGPVVFFPVGNRPTIIVSTAELARVILKEQDKQFAARPPSKAGKYLGFDYKSVLFASHGEYHKKQRRFYQSIHLSPKCLANSTRIRERELSFTVGSILDMHGLSVNLTKTIDTLVLNTMLSITVGVEVGSDRIKELKDMIHRAVQLTTVQNIGDIIPILGFFLRGSASVGQEMKREQELQLQYFKKIIHEARSIASQERREGGNESRTLFQILLDLEGDDRPSDSDITIALLDSIIPGTDTTLVATDWTMVEIFRNPQIKMRVMDELDAVVGKDRVVAESDISKLTYLLSVVKESLRLHPSPPMGIPHMNTQDCKVAQYRIPAKTAVLVNLWAIGRDPRHWENPLDFNPDRFAEGNSEIDIMGQHFEVLPFSAGRRGCLGKFLGMAIVHLNVATLLQCFDWTPEERVIDMTEKVGFTCPRVRDMICSATPRLSSQVYENHLCKFRTRFHPGIK